MLVAGQASLGRHALFRKGGGRTRGWEGVSGARRAGRAHRFPLSPAGAQWGGGVQWELAPRGADPTFPPCRHVALPLCPHVDHAELWSLFLL